LPQLALLALEDGSIFEGISIGYIQSMPTFSVGEVVFNTSMTGYQEILSDPSYCKQLITLTSPHIGNVGTNEHDNEANQVFASGLIVRQLPSYISNWRSQCSLTDFLHQHRVLGIAEIDTRRLTRLIREKGALKGCITSAASLSQDLIHQSIQQAQSFSGLSGLDLAKEVSASKPYLWQEQGLWPNTSTSTKEWQVVAYDFGIKKTILRVLHDLGCVVTVVPAQTPAEEVLALSPDGIFLSNGPGDPQPCDYAIQAIRLFLAKNIPIFGICLGHQLLALAAGAKTVKMKFGHHGGNHPVQSLATKQVMITSQNHGFTVDEATIPDFLEVTHRSLFDHTIQGLRHRTKPAYSFQGHPEAGPGPNDARPLFMPFIQAMRHFKNRHSSLLTLAVGQHEALCQNELI